MKSTIQTIAISAFAALALMACDRNQEKNAIVKIQIPALSAPVHTSSITPPSNIANFNCLAVSVRGPDIQVKSGLGLISNLVMVSTGGTVEIEVPTGYNRVFEVIGLMSRSGTCPSQVSLGGLLSQTNFPMIAVVGTKTADILKDTDITITGAYSLSQARDIRSGTLLTEIDTDTGGGGGGDGGGGGGGGASNCPAYASSFGGGVGSEAAPFLVSTKEHWNAIAAQEGSRGCHYKLTADINFGGDTPNAIGGDRNNNNFTGVLDGDGHTISNGLLPKARNDNSYGLISKLNGTVKNLKVNNFDLINPPDSEDLIITVLTPYPTTATITNVEITGTDITSTTLQDNPIIAGFVATTDYGTRLTISEVKVINFTVDLNIPASSFGGVVANMNSGTISRALVQNLNVTYQGGAPGKVGGLVAEAYGSTASVIPVTIEDSLVNGFTFLHKGSQGAWIGGLFGSLSAVARRVGVTGLSLTNNASFVMGGLVADIWNGSISDAHVQGSISNSTGNSTGGVIGQISVCTTKPCFQRIFSAVSVTGGAGSGPTVGFISSGVDGSGTENSFYQLCLPGANDNITGRNYQVTGKSSSDLQDFTSYPTDWKTGDWISGGVGQYPRLQTISDFYPPALTAIDASFCLQ